MTTVRLEFTAPQLELYQHIKPKATVTACWGRGGGKSWWKRMVCYMLIAQWDGVRRKTRGHNSMRGVRIIPFMQTLAQFKDVHLDGLIEELEGDGDWAFLGGKVDKVRGQVKFPGGSWIKPFPAAARYKIRGKGPRADVIMTDEADGTDAESVDAVAQPWLSEPWSLQIRLFGGTPERGRFGLLYRQHQLGLLGDLVRAGKTPEGTDPELARAVRNTYTSLATWRDYPELVDEDVVREARAKAVAAGKLATFEREWECNFDAGEGLVFPHFDTDFHVRVPPDDMVFHEIVVGGDKGYEDPGCLLLAGSFGHGKDAGIWILDEHYHQHQTSEWWAQQCMQPWAQQYPGLALYHDPSAPDWISAYKKVGAKPKPVDNSIQPGIDLMANLMAVRSDDAEPPNYSARFYVHPRCKNFIREVGLYKRKKSYLNPGSFTDDVVDKDNHAIDTARYICSGHLGLPSTSSRTFSRYDHR